MGYKDVQRKYGALPEQREEWEREKQKQQSLQGFGNQVSDFQKDWSNYFKNGGTVSGDGYYDLAERKYYLLNGIDSMLEQYSGDAGATQYLTGLGDYLKGESKNVLLYDKTNRYNQLLGDYNTSLETINSYADMVANSKYLDKNQLAEYSNAFDTYIRSGEKLFTAGNGYSDSDIKLFNKSKTELGKMIPEILQYYGEYTDEQDFLADQQISLHNNALSRKEALSYDEKKGEEALAQLLEDVTSSNRESAELANIELNLKYTPGGDIDWDATAASPAFSGMSAHQLKALYYQNVQNAVGREVYEKALAEHEQALWEKKDYEYLDLMYQPDFETVVAAEKEKDEEIDGRRTDELYGYEENIYYYIRATQGEDAADEYISHMKNTLKERRGWETARWLASRKAPGLASTLYGFGTGVLGGTRAIGELFTDLDPAVFDYANTSLQEGSYLTDTQKFFHQGAMTMGQQMPAMVATIATQNPLVGRMVSTATAYGLSEQQGRAMGMTGSQAREYALLNAAGELALESVSDKLFGVAGLDDFGKFGKRMDNIRSSLGRVAAKLPIRIAGEELEEISQAYLEPLFLSMVTGAEYEAPELDEILYTALLTAFSTGIMSAPGTAIRETGKQRNYRAIGREIAKGDGVSSLKAKAHEADNATRRFNALYVTEKPTNKREEAALGQLYTRLSKAEAIKNASADRVDISHRLQEAGYSPDQAKAIADALVAEHIGEDLTRDQRRTLKGIKGDEKVADAVLQVWGEGSTSVGQDTAVSDIYRASKINNAADAADLRIIKNKLKSGGIEEKDVADVANAVVASMSGTATKKQQKLLDKYKGNEAVEKSTEYLKDVAEDKLTADTYRATLDRMGMIESEMDAAASDGQVTGKLEDDTDVDVEGKTFVKSTGEVAETVAVKDIGKGGVTLTVNGKTDAAMDDVSFGDAKTNEAFHFVTGIEGMTAEVANKILNHPDLGKENFARDAVRAFRAGVRNDRLVLGRLEPDVISKEDAQRFFNKGREVADSDTDSSDTLITKVYEIAKKQLEKAGMKATGKLRIAKDVVLDPRDPGQKLSAKLAAKIAPSLSVDIVLYNGKNGEFGYYKHSEDAIYLNVNARWDGKSMMTFTLAHELVHRAKAGSPKQFKAFADYLVAEYGKAGESVDDMITEQLAAAKRAGVKMTEDEAFEEVVCDAAQRMLTDTDAGKKLAAWGMKSESNKITVKRIWEKLTELFDRLRAYFKNAAVDSKAAKDFTKLDKNVQKILGDMLVDMSTDAAEKLGTIKAAGMLDKINTTGKGGVRYSLMAFSKDGRRFVDVQADPHIFDGMTVSEMNRMAKSILMEKFANRVIGRDNRTFVNGDSVNEYLHPSKSIDIDIRKAKLTAAGELDNLLDAGVALPNEPDGKDGHVHPDTIDFSYYQTIFKVGNEYFEGIVNIKNIKRGRLLKDVTKIKNITKDIVSSYGNNPKSNFLRDASMDSIRSSDEIVKPKSTTDSDGNQLTTNKNPTGNPDIQHKLAVREDTSAPALLRKVDASAATPMQQEKLEAYREQLKKIDTQKEILRSQNERLKDAKGHAKAMLQSNIRKTKNRITILEDQLARMENHKALQTLVEKERAAAEVRYQESIDQVLQEMRGQYGTIPEGEKAVRDDSLPVSMDGRSKVSRAARTVKGAAVTTDELAREVDVQVAEGKLSYIPITNDETSKKANAWVEKLGWDAALASWYRDVGAGNAGADITARGAVLLNHAAQAGDKKTWLELLFHFQKLATTTAQGLQAMRILKQLDPSDKLYMIRRSVEQMVEDMHLKTDIQLNEDLLTQYKTAETDAQRDEILDQIQQDIADQIPSNFIDKFTALRYLNMLGNIRTQIRNLGGNTTMKVTSALKNLVATGLERLVAKIYKLLGKEFNRSRSAFVGKKLMQQGKADYKNIEALLLDGGRYSAETAQSSAFAKKVQEKRKIFKKNKPLEMYRKATNWATETGDLLFGKAAYARAFAGFLKARGIDDVSKASEQLLDEARVFAVHEAQEQTFRDANWLSSWVAKIGRRTDTPTVGKVLSEGLMPFRKTPANILMRAVEYSPIGLLGSVVQTARAAAKDSNITGDQVINSWAKGLTGTALFGLGMLLNSLGYLTGGADDDEDREAMEKMHGEQNFAITLPNGVNLTFDWMSPSSIPMLMGAQFMEEINEGGFQLSDIESSLTSITDPLVEMSMLQGVSDAFDNIRFAENNTAQMAISLALNYLTQGLTNSMIGQIERTFQDSRETTYTEKDSALPGWLQRSLGTALNKWPGLDYNQIPYVNAWGEEEENPGYLESAFSNMISPSYIDKIEQDSVYNELMRLDEAQEDENVLPSTPSNMYDGRQLTGEEYVALAKTQGKLQRKLVEKLIDTDVYKSMRDSEKAKTISYLYKYAREKAQIDVLGRKKFSSEWLNGIGDKDVVGAVVDHVLEDYGGEEYYAKYLDLQAANPTVDITASDAESYFMHAEPAGIDIETYLGFKSKASGITGDKDPKTGKVKSGSKKKKDVDLIHSLKLSMSQKDALYRAQGYAEDDLKDTPWH